VKTGVAAVVLAAGASRRLGRPKALLDFDGLTALELTLRSLRRGGVSSGVVVTGDGSDVIRRAVDPSPFVWALNPMPEAGRTGSLVIGLGAVGAVDVLFWPVDRPLASADTVRALVAARMEEARQGAAAGAADLLVPEHDGRRGHPLILRAALRPALLAAAPDASLRDLLRDAGASRRVVPVDDPGIHFNLDTETAWEEALTWWRAQPR
jgi:CTP:molybdopterin cytidylyltransferase MocA